MQDFIIRMQNKCWGGTALRRCPPVVAAVSVSCPHARSDAWHQPSPSPSSSAAALAAVERPRLVRLQPLLPLPVGSLAPLSHRAHFLLLFQRLRPVRVAQLPPLLLRHVQPPVEAVQGLRVSKTVRQQSGGG